MGDKITEQSNDNVKYCSDEDEGDEDLLNAVAQWANQKGDETNLRQVEKSAGKRDSRMVKKRTLDSTKNRTPLSSPSPYDAPYNPNANKLESSTTRSINKSPFSLHITNLPYSSTKEAIMKAFEDKECRIASTRLVHNYHSTRQDRMINKKNQGNYSFTGVAFVDMVDKGSYRKGLNMDKMQWLEKGAKSRDSRGRFRKINIRPTRTKGELAEIVKKREEKLALQRHVIKEDDTEHKNSNKRLRDEKGSDQRNANDDKLSNAKKSRQTRNEEGKKTTDSDKKKVSKRERAKKAAILNQQHK